MFQVGKPVTGKQFFDRTNMKKDIKRFLMSKQDFMIKAPRRYGKTSLIKEVLKDKDYIYIDIRKAYDISAIPQEIIERGYEIAGINSIVKNIKENVVSFLSNIKANIKIDYKIVEASAQYLTQQKEKNSCEDLIIALQTLEDIGRSLNQTMILVFDEFQDIKKFKCQSGDILEILRGTLQHFEYINTIFLGSIETIMTDIFENKKSPFFNYCRKLKLLEFDIDELYLEILEAFKAKNIYFEEEDKLKVLLKSLNGHPANSMIVLQNLYYIALEQDKKKITTNDMIKAYENGYYEMLDLVEQYIIELKDKKHYHSVLYNIANNLPQTLTPQALHQVRKGLLNMGYLQKIDKGNYKIIDNFLEVYLLNKDDKILCDLQKNDERKIDE